jgi:hypothetical protein
MHFSLQFSGDAQSSERSTFFRLRFRGPALRSEDCASRLNWDARHSIGLSKYRYSFHPAFFVSVK